MKPEFKVGDLVIMKNSTQEGIAIRSAGKLDGSKGTILEITPSGRIKVVPVDPKLRFKCRGQGDDYERSYWCFDKENLDIAAPIKYRIY